LGHTEGMAHGVGRLWLRGIGGTLVAGQAHQVLSLAIEYQVQRHNRCDDRQYRQHDLSPSLPTSLLLNRQASNALGDQ
jgi:hypothetical protein